MEQQQQEEKHMRDDLTGPLALGTLGVATVTDLIVKGGWAGVGAGALAAAFVYFGGTPYIRAARRMPGVSHLFANRLSPEPGGSKRSVVDRLLNFPGEDAHPHADADDLRPKITRDRGDYPTDNLIAPRHKNAGSFLFSQVLERFTPSLDRIYLATLEDGTMVFCRAEDLCHVALAGTTRAGKTSIQRMLVAQLCYAGARVLILNPHYSRYILDKKEDWTPFEGDDEQGHPYLLYPPMECRSYEVIAHYLRQIAEIKMPERLDRFANGEPVGKPYYVVLDELPDIVKKIPAATGYLDDILRQGAKVNIFLICASQDFLVKTLKMDGGAVRSCYRSAYYVGAGGGDATTGHILLNVKAADIDESLLGTGTVMLRNWQKVKEARIAYVPLMDNAALYRMLGPSTYVPKQHREEEDELVDYASDGNEPNTDKVPAYRSGYRASKSAIERREAREQRLRSVAPVQARPVARAPEIPAQDDPEGGLDRDERAVLAAYRSGLKSGNAIAAHTDIPATRVNKILNRLAVQKLIDWQPRNR